jgi:NADH-quinone oxidoreductase subunit H
MVGIIDQQARYGVWNIFYQPLGFFIFLVCGLAETNRTPFDLPEGESEIVGGFHTEYSGFRWSLFFLSEYTAMVIVSSVATTLYLGGWHFWGVARLINPETSPALYALVGLAIFVAKVLVLVYIFMWFRWTFPRYRYDQLMDLGWKWLTPAALANIVLTGVVYVVVKDVLGLDFTNATNRPAKFALFVGMLIVATPIVLAIVAWINRQGETMDIAEQRRRQMLARAARQARIAEQKAG